MDWFAQKHEHCQHCGSADFEVGVCKPRTLLICDCCQYAAAHIECEEKSKGTTFSEETLKSGYRWYCCKVCPSQTAALVALKAFSMSIDKHIIALQECEQVGHTAMLLPAC